MNTMKHAHLPCWSPLLFFSPRDSLDHVHPDMTDTRSSPGSALPKCCLG
ncbi:rCG50907 [Rattus norvegicus]|uniref:RCG50907 n=1 Tax=Rattus norvegicus TaxID=10116 RepID=A6KJ49_RAT|nr:rCG50907 [Rattus norvegicus]